MRAGLLITFEGIDGSGKTTQIRRLAARLAAAGHRVHTVREPGGTVTGERIRDLLLQTEADPPVPAAEWFLFLAARAQLCARVIEPALQAGDIVLCDRFTDSTLAYQGSGRGMDAALLRRCNAEATGGRQPDLTFWLDLPPELADSRREQRCGADRMEQEAAAFRERVARGYRQIQTEEPDRVVRIDAQPDPDAVFEQVLAHLQPLLATAEAAGV